MFRGGMFMRKFLLLSVLSLTLVLVPKGINAIQPQTGCKQLETIFKAEVKEKKGICSIKMVRKEIHPTHMGKKSSPEFIEIAFNFSFKKVDNQTAVIGELALLEEEVNPVIKELQKGNLEISALHNHMIYEQPRILFVHFQGIGDMMQQAQTIKKTIEKTSHKIN
jgi:hypothetical protein